MPDVGPRAEARKELRDYDNPKNGRNKKYLDLNYLQLLLDKYKMSESELRKWINERKWKR